MRTTRSASSDALRACARCCGRKGASMTSAKPSVVSTSGSPPTRWRDFKRLARSASCQWRWPSRRSSLSKPSGRSASGPERIESTRAAHFAHGSRTDALLRAYVWAALADPLSVFYPFGGLVHVHVEMDEKGHDAGDTEGQVCSTIEHAARRTARRVIGSGGSYTTSCLEGCLVANRPRRDHAMHS
jgi:hypothetical protein